MKYNKVRLGEICQEIYRYPTYYDIEYLDMGIPEIRGELITSNGDIDLNRQKWRFISEKTSSKFSRTVLLKDDLVMSVRGTIGKIGLIPEEFIGGNITANLIRISPNRVRVNERYLWRYMRSTEFVNSLDSASSSTTIKTIKAPDLKDILIPLPPLEEQKRIAEILDRASSLISKRKDAIAKLDTLTQSIFIEMFGDPVTNPKSWEISSIKSLLVDVTNGLTRRRKETEQGSDIVLRLRDIRAGWIDFSDVNRISLEKQEFNRYEITLGDLLFIRVNGNPEYVGRCAIFNGFTEPVYFNDHIMRVKTDHSKVNEKFLVFILNGKHGKREIAMHRKTSAGQHTINQDGLGKINIPIPPLPLQTEFAQRIEAVERLKATHRASLTELQALFASLQHRAFRGEL